MKTILVVDDSRISRNIVKNTFSTMHIPCQFLEASEGKEALQKLHANPVNLVLLDWNMPGCSGMEFLKLVRADDHYRRLPIIMVTSEAKSSNVIEALKNGATDYIIKPISEKVISEKLSRISL